MLVVLQLGGGCERQMKKKKMKQTNKQQQLKTKQISNGWQEYTYIYYKSTVRI